MRFEINFNESRQIWNDFAKSSPHYSIFVNTLFLDSLGQPYQCLTLYESNRIVAGTVLFFDEDGKPLRHNLPYTQFQGIILSDPGNSGVHSKVKKQLEIVSYFLEEIAARFDHYFLCQSWRFEDVRPFLWYNYHSPDKNRFSCTIKYTALLQLSQIHSKSDYIDSLRKLRKREYQKATKEEFVIEETEDISQLLDLYILTFQRQGIDLGETEKQKVTSITQSATINGYGKVLVGKNKDQRITNATLFLNDDLCGYYLIGANNPDFRGSGSSTLLMIENIFRCKNLGLQYVDFVGVNSPNRGDYKISFNAVPKCYFELSI